MKTQITGIIILLILSSCAEKKQRDQKPVAELFPPILIKEWEKRTGACHSNCTKQTGYHGRL